MREQMSKVIFTQTQDGTRIIHLGHPPVNALTQKLRAGLIAAINAAEMDPNVMNVVLAGKGQTFCAGTDIRDYRGPEITPSLASVCEAIESCEKPVVAALHGAVVGGGVELAIAAHARIAHKDTRLGFSEASLGLIPTGGATQRLPRLVGAKAAFDIMMSGAPVTAGSAQSMRLIDDVAQGDVLSAAIDLARQITPDSVVRTRDRREAFQHFESYSEQLRQVRGLSTFVKGAAAGALADLMEIAALLPFEAGIAAEADRFEALRRGRQSKALRHVYTATRRAARSGVAKGTKAHAISQVGIVGASSAGCRLAVRCLKVGLPVVLLDQNNDSRAAGAVFIEKQLAKTNQIGALDQLTQSSDLADLGQADVIIESVIEERALKEGLFRVLGAHAKKGAILGTTTEAFDLAQLAELSGRPEDTIALRIADRMPRVELCEVTSHKDSSDRAIATGCALARRLRLPLIRGYGARASVAQSLFYAGYRACEHLVLRGVSADKVDEALTGFGFTAGLLQLADSQGISSLALQLETHGHSSGLLEEMSERNWNGVRAGTGFYTYEGGRPQANARIERIAARLGAEAGLTPREFSAPRIQLRIWSALLAEGARLVSSGAARRPLDVDIAAINGLGFPAERGGPMKAADLEGLLLMQKALRSYEKEDPVWTPSPLIAEGLKTADGFDAMNHA